jgi:acyl-CoA reductase-like NAD-dependent aldehyde dehydrogenase
LAAGNAIVIKPSEFTSTTTLRLAELASETGLPDGLLNVVTGVGGTVGATLASHPAVQKIAFTGSVRTGQALCHIAAERVVPLTLELGGKSPMVIFADADLEGAARAASIALLANSGQVCSATTRLVVQRSVHDQVVSMIADRVSGLQPGEHFGPIITDAQYARVLDYFRIALDEGATLVTGGGAYEEGTGAEGQFVQPTLYTDVDMTMRIAREELFGPVLVVIPFDEDPEALVTANDTDYGLAASVWTRDVARGLKVAESIDAGQVWINGATMGVDTPFGGFKLSGYGREKGIEGMYDYTQVKTVSVTLPE